MPNRLLPLFSSRFLRLASFLLLAAALTACTTTRTQLRPLGQTEEGHLVLTNADLRVAASALQSGDTEAAKSLYEELLLRHPESPQVWLGLGNAYFLEGDYDSASRAYDRAAQYDPTEAEIRLAQARVALRLRKLSDAQHLYQEFLRDRPNDPIALAGLGVVYELQGNVGLAQETYRQGLRIHPGDEALRANLGLSLALSGKPREAVNVLLGHSGASPNSLPQIRDNLALAYGLLGREDAAKDILSSYQPNNMVQDNLAFYEYLRRQHSKLERGAANAPVTSPASR